ncbi:MAG: class I SAM-dependent RNA methyltransferase [Methyloceanibacter sp.]
MEREVEIGRLGAQGDGVAQGPEGPLFVPFALPGERVRVALDPGDQQAQLLAVLEASPDRIAPICPHFGICGGCALQHLEERAYLAWKRDQVRTALQSRGLEAEVDPVRSVPLASRRRASFALAHTRAGVVLGYHKRGSHEVIGVEVCPVLAPEIVTSVPTLRSALASLAPSKSQARVCVTAIESGLDVAVEGALPRLSAERLGALAATAIAAGVARLTLNGEVVLQQGRPAVMLAGARVSLPPIAFLQASREAEQILVDLVSEGVDSARRVADLFSGLGTFTMALARLGPVDAFEQDAGAVAALAEAARMTPKLKPVRTFVRDLFRTPLRAKEFAPYAAVVLDPPRAGAKAQAVELAASSVRTVVAVSCNPGTLARDLRILVDGGYRLTRVVPVDQFRFSPHIEVVAQLQR